MRIGSLASESWNAWALPWNVPISDDGSLSSRSARDLALLLVDVLLGLGGLGDQGFEAIEILLGGDELGLVLCLLGDRLIECGLQRTRIDHGQRVTFVHVLAFDEGNRLQLAVNLT